MKILSTTLCYPTPERPEQGAFVRRRLAAMAELVDVRVVCPVPYFPGRSTRRPEDLPDADPPVCYPRMLYLPGAFKTLDATFYALTLRRLREIRKTYPFDLIDAHFVWPDGVGAAIAAWKLGVPIVITVRGKIVSQSRYLLRRRRIAATLRSADGRIAVSESLARWVNALAGDDPEVRVIPNGVDANVFAPGDPVAARAALGMPDGPKYVVSVGQVREIKGFDRLVAALPEVRRRAGDVRLILVGPGVGETGYERRVDRLIRQYRLDDVVHRVGVQDAESVARHLAAADVFALATRSEGWCNAIHEALAVGTPVVTTDVGGNREQVASDQLGLVVPFGQPTALADALVWALKRTWDRSAIVEAGSRRSWDQAAAETVEYFEQVLSGRLETGGPAT